MAKANVTATKTATATKRATKTATVRSSKPKTPAIEKPITASAVAQTPVIENPVTEVPAVEQKETKQSSPKLGLAPVSLPKDTADAWDYAINAVSYPVFIKELFFKHTDDDGEEFTENAEGMTNTGRETKFFGVVVDRNNDGRLSTISTVTDTYDTIPVPQVYNDLKNDLVALNIEHYPERVYVSGNGGMQELRVKIPGCEWVNSEKQITLALRVNTSIDGKTKHQVSLCAVDQDGVELSGIDNVSFNLAGRHTKTIRERHIAFTSVLNNIVESWNTVIVPSMVLMSDSKFDRQFAVELIKNICEESGIPERHADKATTYFESKVSGECSLFDVYHGLNAYLEESMDTKRERLATFREKMNKTAGKIQKQVLAKLA